MDSPNGMVYGQYGDCRRLGHAWFDVPSDWVGNLGHPLTVRCERCLTERRDQVGINNGELRTRNYAYPDGYAYGRGEKPTAADFRRMYVDQMIRRTRSLRAKKAAAARKAS